jgi:hypothetical protein
MEKQEGGISNASTRLKRSGKTGLDIVFSSITGRWSSASFVRQGLSCTLSMNRL